jgi:hypothetical protein
MKMLGAWVRLADGRKGHVAGATIDGYTIVIDGRIVTALPKDVTAIPAPYSPPIPEPERTAQRPIQTSHEEPPPVQRVEIPPGVSVMRNGAVGVTYAQ